MPYLALFVYHLAFWWHRYTAPETLATGELASMFFPYWHWMGRQLRQGRSWCRDHLFYYYPGCLPVCSAWYPITILTSGLTSGLPINHQFTVYVWMMLSHFFIGSVGWYVVFSQFTGQLLALYGALSMTYGAYAIKCEPPIAFTLAWMPYCLWPGWPSGVGMGLSLLAGYWPLLVYWLPVALLAQWWWYGWSWWWLLGSLLALPQVVSFAWYYPQSIRWHGACESQGTVPWWRFLDLLWPDAYRTVIHGYFWTEMSLFVGWLPLLTCWGASSRAWWMLIIAVLGTQGWWTIGRIPARWCWLVSVSLIWLSVTHLTTWPLTLPQQAWLVLLQALSLWLNRSTTPLWPFTEWWQPISRWLANPPDLLTANHTYPYFTGYLLGWPTSGYTGSMALRTTLARQGLTQPTPHHGMSHR